MKYEQRLEMVRFAEAHGVKPAARQHGCQVKTVRKWLGRWREANHARFQPFEQAQVDVKYLNDIPFYVQQMWRHGDLPRFQYTWRDVKTGAVFLGFAKDLSEEHACCFVHAVSDHLSRAGTALRGFATIQTDNGSEFSGAERQLDKRRGFHHAVEHAIGAKHRFIPPGKKNYQADVESLHRRIEEEFFDLETFRDHTEFYAKASAWQLWWNCTRKNFYKGKRSPDDILLQDAPKRDPAVWLIPAIDLDRAMKKKMGTGGCYVPALPGFAPDLAHGRENSVIHSGL